MNKNKNSSRDYEKALMLSEDLRNKFNCALADIPTNTLSEEEKHILTTSWILLGYTEKSAKMFSGLK